MPKTHFGIVPSAFWFREDGLQGRFKVRGLIFVLTEAKALLSTL